eukprot:m.186172 g.186172  ORF g.186172 m.186172 type:complete len:684 (+) comp15588_c1_seq2:239-2290(+)
MDEESSDPNFEPDEEDDSMEEEEEDGEQQEQDDTASSQGASGMDADDFLTEIAEKYNMTGTNVRSILHAVLTSKNTKKLLKDSGNTSKSERRSQIQAQVESPKENSRFDPSHADVYQQEQEPLHRNEPQLPDPTLDYEDEYAKFIAHLHSDGLDFGDDEDKDLEYDFLADSKDDTPDDAIFKQPRVRIPKDELEYMRKTREVLKRSGTLDVLDEIDKQLGLSPLPADTNGDMLISDGAMEKDESESGETGRRRKKVKRDPLFEIVQSLALKPPQARYTPDQLRLFHAHLQQAFQLVLQQCAIASLPQFTKLRSDAHLLLQQFERFHLYGDQTIMGQSPFKIDLMDQAKKQMNKNSNPKENLATHKLDGEALRQFCFDSMQPELALTRLAENKKLKRTRWFISEERLLAIALIMEKGDLTRVPGKYWPVKNQNQIKIRLQNMSSAARQDESNPMYALRTRPCSLLVYCEKHLTTKIPKPSKPTPDFAPPRNDAYEEASLDGDEQDRPSRHGTFVEVDLGDSDSRDASDVKKSAATQSKISTLLPRKRPPRLEEFVEVTMGDDSFQRPTRSNLFEEANMEPEGGRASLGDLAMVAASLMGKEAAKFVEKPTEPRKQTRKGLKWTKEHDKSILQKWRKEKKWSDDIASAVLSENQSLFKGRSMENINSRFSELLKLLQNQQKKSKS